MAAIQEASAGPERRDVRATRMGVIAFASHNLTTSCLFGSFGVVMSTVEQRLHVTREVSALAVPLTMLVAAGLGPTIGSLANRVSTRLLMLAGTLMAVAAFLILATTASVPAYLLAYALLLGPAMSLCGSIVPPILVTRWFHRHRGRALGIVHMPVMMAVMPLLVAIVVRDYGLPATYLLLAGVMALNLIGVALIVDAPPAEAAAIAQVETGEAPSWTTRALLTNRTYLTLALGLAVFTSTVVMLGAHLVPMAIGFGIPRTQAAGLQTLHALAAMAGTPLLGWLADKIGGRAAMGIASVNFAILLALLLTQPPFALLAVIVALIGFHSAAIVACFGLALSKCFGQANFGRAYGLGNLLTVPLMAGAVPLAAITYVRTGSYATALTLHVVLLLASAALLLLGLRRGQGLLTPRGVGRAPVAQS